MHKVLYEKDGKHGIPYEYLLNKVFMGTPRTAKQMIRMTTFVENKCIERKGGSLSQVSELVVVQEKFGKEIEELRIKLDANDAKIMHLKLQNQKLFSEGPGATDELAVENEKL